MKGICKLCLKEGELQQSHIIPRSYFKRLKKDDGKIMVIQEGKKALRETLTLKSLCYVGIASSSCQRTMSTMEYVC